MEIVQFQWSILKLHMISAFMKCVYDVLQLGVSYFAWLADQMATEEQYEQQVPLLS